MSPAGVIGGGPGAGPGAGAGEAELDPAFDTAGAAEEGAGKVLPWSFGCGEGASWTACRVASDGTCAKASTRKGSYVVSCLDYKCCGCLSLTF